MLCGILWRPLPQERRIRPCRSTTITGSALAPSQKVDVPARIDGDGRYHLDTPPAAGRLYGEIRSVQRQSRGCEHQGERNCSAWAASASLSEVCAQSGTEHSSARIVRMSTQYHRNTD